MPHNCKEKGTTVRVKIVAICEIFMTLATIKQLFTYPVKGLTPQAMSELALTAGHGIKGDRAFALMFADNLESAAKIPAENAPWMSKKYLAVQNDKCQLIQVEVQQTKESNEQHNFRDNYNSFLPK